MVPITVQAVLLMDPFDLAEPIIRGRASMIVRKSIFDGAAWTRDHTPVVTGNLKGSVREFFDNDLQGGWATDVDYGPHVEWGTIHMAPRMMFQGGADYVRPSFNAAMKELGGPIL